MRQTGVVRMREMAAAEVPLPLRFLGKLVLEVLPAATASVIGAFLLAYYQLGHPAAVAAVQPVAMESASPQMMQLLRDEHSLIRDFLLAQEAATQNRGQAADDSDVRVAADVKNVMPIARHPMTAAGVKPPHNKPSVIASATPEVSVAAAQLPPVVIAAAQPTNGTPSSAPLLAPSPAHPSLFTRTLAVPGQVVAVTLHAVMTIGGIPSWIGRRVGGDVLDTGPSPAAS